MGIASHCPRPGIKCARRRRRGACVRADSSKRRSRPISRRPLYPHVVQYDCHGLIIDCTASCTLYLKTWAHSKQQSADDRCGPCRISGDARRDNGTTEFDALGNRSAPASSSCIYRIGPSRFYLNDKRTIVQLH